MKRCLFVLFLLAFSVFVYPQKVGLVLSGGGAKGLAHIGIIKALEENDIPIDCITGTSMGAIVGALYAMGYTPDEMEALVKSEEFKRWYTGQIEDKYIYYFKRDKATPDFFDLKISFKDSTSRKQHFLPTSLVNPVQMNIAFLNVFAPATAQCRGSFNDLFIPFRCVASDVYHKEQVIYSEGDLGDAVRASMSFPLVFKPIMRDSTLVYDGGIYNNFPADVMEEAFEPDIIIGSVVASNPKKPDENDLIGQVENMIMQKTDYSLPDSTDIMMRFYFTDVNLLDFDKVDKISKIGYDKAISLMDTIKSRIQRRVTKAEMDLRRDLYKKKLPELVFKNINVNGASPQQSLYIKKEIYYSTGRNRGTFTFEEFKKSYFKLLTDGIISEIIPHAVYNHDEGYYDLNLDVKIGTPLSIKLGGHISNTSNQIYVGVSYKDLNHYSKDFTLEGQLGKIYNNVQLAAKLDLATAIPTSYRVIMSYSSFDYYKGDDLFFKRGNPSINRKVEGFLKLKVAFPFMLNKKAEISLGIASQKDTYVQSTIVDFENMDRDKSSYELLGGAISFGGNTLNAKQYATAGSRDELSAHIYVGREKFKPANGEEYSYNDKIAWIQISYENESYFHLYKNWTLGTYLEAYYSSRNFSENYTATMLAAGQFAPVPQLKMIYNEDFRANQYIAAGIKPIYKFNNMFHVSGEVYGFLPIFPIQRNNLNKAQYGKLFSKFNCFAQISGVCVLPFASISAYVNYSRFPNNSWNFGITLGWQIFNESFFD